MNNPDTYIKKPEPFYAFVWTGDNLNELKMFLSAKAFYIVDDKSVIINFGDTSLTVLKNSFICTNPDGTYKAVNHTVFAKNYQRFIIPGPETEEAKPKAK